MSVLSPKGWRGRCVLAWSYVTVLVLVSCLHAEFVRISPSLPVTVLTDFAGHALGAVNGIAFDSTGCLWLATHQGVCRIDGQRITRFGPREGLPDLHTYHVVCDHEGVGYAGTWRGLAAFRGGRFETVANPGVGGQETGPEAVTGCPAGLLILGRDGGLWVPGDGGILRRVEPGGVGTSAVRTPSDAVELPSHGAVDRHMGGCG